MHRFIHRFCAQACVAQLDGSSLFLMQAHTTKSPHKEGFGVLHASLGLAGNQITVIFVA